MKYLIDYGILGIVSAVLILTVQHYIFDVPIKASYTGVLLLLIVFMLAVVSMSLLIASIFSKNKYLQLK